MDTIIQMFLLVIVIMAAGGLTLTFLLVRMIWRSTQDTRNNPIILQYVD